MFLLLQYSYIAFGQNTGIQKKLFVTYTQKALKQITEDNIKTTNQKAEGTSGVTEASGSVRPERVDKWPNSMSAILLLLSLLLLLLLLLF